MVAPSKKGVKDMENEKEKEVTCASQESAVSSSKESESASCCYEVIPYFDCGCDPCHVPAACCC